MPDAPALVPTDLANPNVEERIRSWLTKQGYPLEMRIADALQRQRLFPTLANYYDDPVTGQSRQIDIIAGIEHPSGFLNIELVIECKRSSKRPWLVLSAAHSSDRLAPGREYALTSGPARVLLSKHIDRLDSLPWWKWSNARGVGIVPAFDGGADDAFKAISGAMAAAIARRNEWSTRVSDALVFIFPVAIVENDLFECRLAPSGGIDVIPIQEAKIYLPMRFGDEVGTCVHVISAKHVEPFCQTARQAVDALKDLCVPETHRLLDQLVAQSPRPGGS